MLEQPILRVRSSELHDTQNQPVGQILLVPPFGLHGWFFGPTWAIHEVFDQPLVFTLSRTWTLFPRWHVRDAEDNSIGWVTSRTALDRWDQVLFRLDRHSVLRAPQGWELGRWDGSCLRFDPVTVGQPLLRMLMLALILRRVDSTS